MARVEKEAKAEQNVEEMKEETRAEPMKVAKKVVETRIHLANYIE